VAKNFVCWVIVVGSEATAFRSRNQEDLVPTLKQLQRTQPDVVMKWYERGKLWDSVEDAEQALSSRRPATPRRGKGWRPGGEHVDPKAKHEVPRDQKRARFKSRLIASKSRSATSGPSRLKSGK